MHKVLITATGTGTAFALATRLRANWGSSIKIIAADSNPEHLVTTSLLADRFIQIPLATSDKFDDVVYGILENENIDTYVPIINEEINKSGKYFQRFPKMDIWSSPLSARLAIDKAFAKTWLQSIPLPVPRKISFDDVELERSYFVKPINGFGSKGAQQLSGNEIINQIPAQDIQQFLIEDLCEKPEITVDSFYDIRKGFGKAVARERIEIKSGVCTKARIFEDLVISSYAEKIAVSLAQRGTICFQIMRSHGEWVVTDINLRPGAGTTMTVAAGVDVLAAAFACRWNEPYSKFLEKKIPQNGVFVTRQYSEFLMTA